MSAPAGHSPVRRRNAHCIRLLFILCDGDLAVAEALAGRLQITDPAITKRYPRRLELLCQAAITGVQPQNYAARSQANRPLGADTAGIPI